MILKEEIVWKIEVNIRLYRLANCLNNIAVDIVSESKSSSRRINKRCGVIMMFWI